MKKLLLPLVLAVSLLGGCSYFQALQTASTSSPSAQNISDARNVAYALKASYGVAVKAVLAWALTPKCGQPDALPQGACPTQAAINNLATAQATASGIINKMEALALSATPSMSDLNLAIQAAQSAYSSFQSAMATYGVKGSN